MPAFPVPFVNAATAHSGHRLAGDAALHHGALFDRGHADAFAAGNRAHFANALPNRASARPNFRDAFTTVRNAGSAASVAALRTAVACGGVAGHSGRNNAGQEGIADVLPDHAFSLMGLRRSA